MTPAMITPIARRIEAGFSRRRTRLLLARLPPAPNTTKKFHISRSSLHRYQAANYSRSCRYQVARAAEDGLRHARNEQHVDDERDENHQARDKIRDPHLHGIVPIEGLLEEAIHKTCPDIDEGSGNGADHGEAQQHIQEVKELGFEAVRHEQRDEHGTEESGDSV